MRGRRVSGVPAVADNVLVLQELSEYLTQPAGNGIVRGDSNESNGACIERPYLGGKSWYYGNISRAQCDTLLNNHGLDGDFLIRDSETSVSIQGFFS